METSRSIVKLLVVLVSVICFLFSCTVGKNYELVLDLDPQSNLPIRYASIDSTIVVCEDCNYLKFVDRPVKELYLVGKKCVIDDSVSPILMEDLQYLVSFPGKMYLETTLDSLISLRAFSVHYPFYDFLPGFLSKNKHLRHLLIRLEDESAITIDLNSFDSLHYFAVEFNRLDEFPKQILTLKSIKSLRVWVRKGSINKLIPTEISQLNTLQQLEVDVDICGNIDVFSQIPNLEYLLVSSFSDLDLLYSERAKLQHLKGFDIVGLNDEEFEDLAKFLPMVKRRDWPKYMYKKTTKKDVQDAIEHNGG